MSDKETSITLGFKVNESDRDRFNALFISSTIDKRGEFFNHIVEFYKKYNSIDIQKKLTDLETKNQELEKVLSEIETKHLKEKQSLQQDLEHADSIIGNLTEEKEALEDTLKNNDEKIHISEINKTLLEEINPDINAAIEFLVNVHNNSSSTIEPPQVIVNLTKAQYEILNLFASRLNKKLNQEIDIQLLLKEVPIRYITEQAAETYFPFVVSQKEIKQILNSNA